MNNDNEESLYFSYLNLEEILNKFYKNNINNVDLTLIISLEKDYYMGENMKLIMSDLRRLMNNKEIIWNINGKLEKFKVNKLSLFVGDVLNRHMFYYRHCADYFDKHNIDQEDLIPLDIRKQFEERSYIEGKQEGKDWFKDNIDAFNLFSDEKVLTKDYYIGDDITTIFEETENTPKLEYICYEHWLKHPRYNEIFNSLIELINMPDSLIDRCYDYEADKFLQRLVKRNELPEYVPLFLQQSRKYLIDETVPSTIESSTNNPNNYMEIYYHGNVAEHYSVFLGKNASKNTVISKKLDNELSGIKNYSKVIIKDKDF